jgi:ribA/ribD-fused uncharacterized protein
LNLTARSTRPSNTPTRLPSANTGAIENGYVRHRPQEKLNVGARNVEIRRDWDEVKLRIMEGLVRQKFSKDPVLRQRLLDTGDQDLVEGNTWGDTFWGVCRGQGSNWLGRILMDVRAELNGLVSGR